MGAKRAKKLGSNAVVQASDDAIIGNTLAGAIVSWNKGAEKMYGYKAQEVLGQPISILIPADKPNEPAAIMEQLRRGEHITGYKTTRITKAGRPIEVSLTIAPIKNKDGEVVGASVIAHDISRRKRAKASLRLTEKLFQLALQHTPITVSSQDVKLRYTWINSPILAWASQNVVGKTDIELVGGKEGARLTNIKRKVLSTGTPSRTIVTVTLRGVAHYFDLLVERLQDARGRVIGLISTSIEISSWKEQIGELQVELDQLKRLRGLLAICAWCKKIKDEHNIWQNFEKYIQAHSDVKFTHGVCPECLQKLYSGSDPREQSVVAWNFKRADL